VTDGSRATPLGTVSCGGDRGGRSSRAAASAGGAPLSCAPASAPASEPASGVPPSNASMQGPSSSLTVLDARRSDEESSELLRRIKSIWSDVTLELLSSGE
jgi:hypothetical protein